MKRKIQPAITPEEWKALAVERGAASADVVVLDDGSRGIRIGDSRSYDPAWIAAEDAPAFAALALHDHPNGFTWDDVDALHMAAEIMEAGVFSDIADRIAALLPPRS